MIKVFISGCFDNLHTGHLELMQFAKAQGGYLIVSIASDDTIRALKREPIIREHDRYLMVNALKCVDECFISRGSHDNNDCFQYIRNYCPDVWVVNDTDQNLPEKEALANELGIKLVFNYRPENSYSTTGIIKEIQSNSQLS